MVSHTRKPNWNRVMARLRRGVAAGDLASITDLALSLAEGIRDRNGRVLVRRNAPYAVTLLRRAAERGDATAAGSLGYAYDVGNGIRPDRTLALDWYRRAVRLGNSSAASNIATVHRDLGDLRSAHRWAVRAMEMGDGNAAVTVGYNYLYGIGVRRDPGAARRLFHNALRANTSEHGREEALYNLAIADVDNGKRRRAIQLLQRANKDGDYPEAESLSAQLRGKADLTPCRCRRHLRKSLRGHAPCPQHPASLRRA